MAPASSRPRWPTRTAARTRGSGRLGFTPVYSCRPFRLLVRSRLSGAGLFALRRPPGAHQRPPDPTNVRDSPPSAHSSNVQPRHTPRMCATALPAHTRQMCSPLGARRHPAGTRQPLQRSRHGAPWCGQSVGTTETTSGGTAERRAAAPRTRKRATHHLNTKEPAHRFR